MSTAGSEFDGHPFVAGKIRGLRSFRVPPEGNRLTGCTFPIDWEPGVNHAKHIGPLMGGPVTWVRDRDKLVKHEISGSGCSCGYYGFTDGSDDYDYYASSVSGIIEGYGTVTIGTRGFRASKARIVALIDWKMDPTPPPVWSRLDKLATWVDKRKDMVAVIAGLLAFTITTVGIAAQLWPLVVVGMAGGLGSAVGLRVAIRHTAHLFAAVNKWAIREAGQKRRPRSPYLDKLLAHEDWQGIPVFHSKEEAMKAFPLGMVGPDA